MLLDQLHHAARVEDGHRHDRGTGEQAHHDPGLVAERVEERVHDQVAVLPGDLAELTPDPRDADGLPMRGAGALAAAGGAGGEEDVGEVVGGDCGGALVDVDLEAVGDALRPQRHHVGLLGEPDQGRQRHPHLGRGGLELGDLGAVEEAVGDTTILASTRARTSTTSWPV